MRQRLLLPVKRLLTPQLGVAPMLLILLSCLCLNFMQVSRAQIEIPDADLNSMCADSDYYNTAIYGCTPCGEGAVKN